MPHACCFEEVMPHRVLPRKARGGLYDATQEAPADVRVRPGWGSTSRSRHRELLGELCDVLILPAREAEFEVVSQRQPGAICKHVAHGRALGPADSAELRYALGQRVLQRDQAVAC